LFSQDILGGEINIIYNDNTKPYHTLSVRLFQDATMNIDRPTIDVYRADLPITLNKNYDILISPDVKMSFYERTMLLSSGYNIFTISDSVPRTKYQNVTGSDSLFELNIQTFYNTPSVLGSSSAFCVDDELVWTYDNGILKHQLNCVEANGKEIYYSIGDKLIGVDTSDYQFPTSATVDSNGLFQWNIPSDTGNYIFGIDINTTGFGATVIRRVMTVKTTQALLSYTREVEARNHLQVFPTPTQNHLTIQFDYHISNNTQIQIFDMVGHLVHQQAMTQQREELNIGHLSSGMYVVRVVADGKAWTRKIIKN